MLKPGLVLFLSCYSRFKETSMNQSVGAIQPWSCFNCSHYSNLFWMTSLRTFPSWMMSETVIVVHFIFTMSDFALLIKKKLFVVGLVCHCMSRFILLTCCLWVGQDMYSLRRVCTHVQLTLFDGHVDVYQIPPPLPPQKDC